MAQEDLVVGLMDVEVGVLDVERRIPLDGGADALAGEDVVERGGDVEIEGVAELVELGRAVGFNAGGLVERVVAAEGGFAERAEQIAQGLVAEEVHALSVTSKRAFRLPSPCWPCRCSRVTRR